MLTVEHLNVTFQDSHHRVHAVQDVSFTIGEGQSVGLVGESGSGKSVTALSLMRLLPEQATLNGTILWQGQNLSTASEDHLRQIRGKEIGLIFQNPLASLNPVFTIGNQLIETIRLHDKVSETEAKEKAIFYLKKVRIPDPENRLDDYPHQFSLGMCQRVMIALTLAMKPKLLIADEPTASLDVTIQAEILSLLSELKTEFKMSILLISHDLGVIAQNCDHILVMYLGKLVESGPTRAVFTTPKHPYTEALLSAIPSLHLDEKKQLKLIPGDPPSLLRLPTGCSFHPRCPHAVERCVREVPQMVEVGDGHWAGCWLNLG